MVEIKLTFKKDFEMMSLTEDFFYMLNDGGWIKPEEYLEEEDAKKLNDAIDLIDQFRREGLDNGAFEEC